MQRFTRILSIIWTKDDAECIDAEKCAVRAIGFARNAFAIGRGKSAFVVRRPDSHPQLAS
jgi:hypothetical protein